MKKFLLFVVSFFCIHAIVSAQLDVLEKDYAVSRKARKGYLGSIETHPSQNTFDLIYVLKSGSNKIITETYTYDKDLALINTVKEEDDVDKVKTKYKWFKFKGETYERQSVFVRANMKQEMVFRDKTIRFKWSWFRGGYAKKVILGDKVKPKDEESGARYMFRGGYYENDAEGYMLVCAGLRDGNDNAGSYLKYHILSADKDVNLTKKDEITFTYAKAPIVSQPMEDDDPATNDDKPRDWVLIFAPQGGPGMKKVEGDAKMYTYCRYSPTGALIEKFDFSAPVTGWRILGAFERDGQVYLYGPGIGKDKYNNEIFKGPILSNTSDEEGESKGGGLLGGLKALTGGEFAQVTQDAIDKRLDEMKYSNFQVAKLTAGKLAFISQPTIDELNDHNVKPEGQKRKMEFDGKRFITTGISLNSSNNVFIAGQDYKLDNMGKNKGSRLYKGLFLLQFAPDGTYMRNYGVELDQRKYLGMFTKGLTPDMYPAYSRIMESPDHTKIYWMITMCKAIDKDTDIDSDYNFFSGTTTTTTTTSYSPLYSVEYGVINTATGTASEFKTLGEDEKRKFYLFPDKNVLQLNNYVVYLSETEKGDKILLSRFDLNK